MVSGVYGKFLDIREFLNEYFKFRRMPPTVDSDARDIDYDPNANIHASISIHVPCCKVSRWNGVHIKR